MKLWRLAAMVALVATSSAGAEQNDGRWGIGLEFGLWKQVGGSRDYSNVDQFVSLRGRHWLTPAWSLDMGMTYGWTRPGVAYPGLDAGFTLDSGAGLYTRIWQPNILGTYRIRTAGRWRPWLSAGIGVTRWDVRDLRETESVGLWPTGVGLQVWDEDGNYVDGHGLNVSTIIGLGTEVSVSSNLFVDVGLRYNLLLNQNTDSVGFSPFWGADEVDANSGLVEGLLGLTYRFGSNDKDGDGIPNSRDAAPEESEDFDGYRDDDGAPDLDNDRDGILDEDDGCLGEPEDIDGYQDTDGCSDPDNDGDGVLDARDRCPDETEDVDGFQDEDGCPDPDNDGDGVRDEEDLCDFTPAGVRVDATGCPLIEEVRDEMILEGVRFRSGGSELTAASLAILDEVARTLLDAPEVRVEIGGHTDNSGSADLNRRLSQARAESVRTYLVSRGLEARRITAVGYGAASPIADNATEKGRAVNRRVELKRTDR